MSTVIDLCSSDEEEAVVKPQSKAAARRRRSKPVTPEERKTDGSCSSGSEDRKHKQKKPRQLTFGKFGFLDDSDSDDDLVIVPLGITSKAKENLKPETVATRNVAPLVGGAKPSAKLTVAAEAASPSAIKKKPPVFNPYAKRPTSVPSSCILTAYPNPSSQTFEDLRPKFILAFWKHAQTLVHASYNLGKMDQICRRITALAFSTFPIRSQEEYCQRFTSTTDVASILDALKAVNQFSTPSNDDNDGRYFSIPEACLVAMMDHVDSIAQSNNNNNVESLLAQKEYWISLSELLPMIDNRLKRVCPGRLTHSNQPDNGAAHYLESSTRSAEFKQIEKLQSKASGQDLPYTKAHRQKGLVYYELTNLGYATAKCIRQRTFPCPRGHYRTSNLTLVEPKFQGICLAVDRREGGGPKKQLHKMCNKLDSLKIPYFVRSLDIGDYCFFTTDTYLLLPVLVERKSVQDVAASIFDGRWTNQKRRMYQGQYVFGYSNCRMVYIIEGNKESQQLTGGYVGERRFDVTREKLDDEIENLQSEGFEVLRTLSRDHSMVEIARWASRVRQDYVNGKLKAQYTYEEFLGEVAKIPRNTDFSKIAKDRTAEDSEFQIKKQSTEVKEAKKPAAQRKLNFGPAAAIGKNNNYDGMSVKELKDKCEEYGLAKTGKKADLIARLNGPKPPKVWLDRKARNVGYVPSRYNTCATALLVGLYLEQKKADTNWTGMTKEELYPLAESLDISKDPFSGVATGPYKYDGWSSMSDLRQGEIPLVVHKKGKFMLTTSSDVSGYPLAEAMHQWCHQNSACSCREAGYNHDGVLEDV